MFPTWAKNILFLLVYMISGLILVIIIEDLLSGTQLLPLNTLIEGAVTGFRMPTLTTLMVIITKLSDPFFFSVATVILAGILVSRGNFYDAALFLFTFFISAIALTALKNIFQVSRPISPLYRAEGWSFPSGHATIATTFFFLLAHTFYNKMKTTKGRAFLVLGSISGTILVGLSRLYLGAHWTLDIIGGMALGMFTVSFAVLIFNIFLSNRRSFKKMIDL